MAVIDPLNAERAFLHDAFAADRYVRIQLQGKRFGPFPVQPVESPDLVGAVLAAETRSDAAVVRSGCSALPCCDGMHKQNIPPHRVRCRSAGTSWEER